LRCLQHYQETAEYPTHNLLYFIFYLSYLFVVKHSAIELTPTAVKCEGVEFRTLAEYVRSLSSSITLPITRLMLPIDAKYIEFMAQKKNYASKYIGMPSVRLILYIALNILRKLQQVQDQKRHM
jgi:hypothetical protein